MKFIRKSSLWERDDLYIWVIMICIAVVALLYRLIPIFFIFTQRCILYYDTWVDSSPSLILAFFAIFEALFIWNLVIFVDSVSRHALSRTHLVIHMVNALILGAAIASTIHNINFSYEYDSIIKYADAEWNENDNFIWMSKESCRESRRYLGRWEINVLGEPESTTDFPYKELWLSSDLTFRLYDENQELVDYGRWGLPGDYDNRQFFDYHSRDYFQEFEVTEYHKQELIFTEKLAYSDHEEAADLVIQLKKLPSIEEPKYILDFDWSFIHNREKYGDKR